MTDVVTDRVGTDKDAREARRSELQALSSEIVDLFYAQTFSPESFSTPADVSTAFSEMLLRHWELCCIAIYLRDHDGHLAESAIHIDEHFNQESAHIVGKLLATSVERENRELQVWLDRHEESLPGLLKQWRGTLERAGLRAGVALPIHARGQLVGALIAVTAFPERLRAALNGVRFIAAPIMIAIGNALRAGELRAQHEHIAHLVEELQERTGELEEANRELRRVAHYRSLFLSRMSHELRTPLTAILGFTEILVEHEKLTPEQRRFCEKIQSSGLQLQTSLTQLVDLSRIEAGQMELFLHEFSLREALRETCKGVERLAQKKYVTIDCTPPPGLPPLVSDEGKLRQVLYNFFGYAISRSPERGVVRINVEEPSPSLFHITIEDDGAPVEDTAQVFKGLDESFYDNNWTSMIELGVVIAHRLLEALGGSVKIENREGGGGLRMLIELPARPKEKFEESAS